MTSIRVCAGCRLAVESSDAAYCARCGSELIPIDVEGHGQRDSRPAAMATGSFAMSGSPSGSVPVAMPVFRVGAAIPASVTFVVAAWIGLTLAGTLLVSMFASVSPLMFGLVGSFVAGLGISLSVDVGAGFLGGGAGGSVWLVPLPTLALIGAAAALGVRRDARSEPDLGWGSLVLRAGVATAGIAIAVTVLLATITEFVGLAGMAAVASSVNSSLGGLSSLVSVSAAPQLGAVILVLYPTILIGAIVGRLSIGYRPSTPAMLVPVRDAMLAGAMGFAWSIVTISLGFVAVMVVAAIAAMLGSGGNPLDILYSLFAPNLALIYLPVLALDWGVVALPAWLLAPTVVVVLMVPGLVTGLRSRAKSPMTRATFVIVAALTYGIISIVAALLTLPRVGTSGSGLFTDLISQTGLDLDLPVNAAVPLAVWFAATCVAGMALRSPQARPVVANLEERAARQAASLRVLAMRVVARAKQEGVRGLGDMARGWLRRRTRRQAGGAIAVALVAVGAVATVSYLNSPEMRLRGALESIAARSEGSGLQNWQEVGSDLGIAYAPADILISVTDVHVAGDRATWTLRATRGDEMVTELGGSGSLVDRDGGLWLDVASEALPSENLVQPVASEAEAETLVAAAREANAAFDTWGLRLGTYPEWEELPTEEDVDPSRFSDEEPVPVGGQPREFNRYYYETPFGQTLLYSTETNPGIAPRLVRGSLDRSAFKSTLLDAYRRLAAAVAAGDAQVARTLFEDAAMVSPSGLDEYVGSYFPTTAGDVRVGRDESAGIWGAVGSADAHYADGAWRFNFPGTTLVQLDATAGWEEDGGSFRVVGYGSAVLDSTDPGNIKLQIFIKTDGFEPVPDGDESLGVYLVSAAVNGNPVDVGAVSRANGLEPGSPLARPGTWNNIFLDLTFPLVAVGPEPITELSMTFSYGLDSPEATGSVVYGEAAAD